MRKPHMLLVSDTPNWAIARNVDALEKELSWKYHIDKAHLIHSRYVRDARGYMDIRDVDVNAYDLINLQMILYIPEDALAVIRRMNPRKTAVTISAHHCFDNPAARETFVGRLPLVKCVLCLSDSIYQRACSAFESPVHPVFFTPHGIDPTVFTNTRDNRNETFTIGWAGNAAHGQPIDHKRFYEIIVPVIKKLVGDRRLRFKVAGRNIQAEVADRLREWGVEVGEVQFDDMPAWYNSIDLYLQASRSEAIASTTVEALSCGTPVVSTRVGYAENLIVDGVNGKIVEPSVAEYILQILTFMEVEDYTRIFSANQYIRDNVLDWRLLASFTDIAWQKALEASKQ